MTKYKLPVAEKSSQNQDGNKSSDSVPKENGKQCKKMNHNKKLQELLLGIIPEKINQSTETYKNTNESKNLSQTLCSPGNDSQNISQLADSLQKENSRGNLEGYQMYIKTEVEDTSDLYVDQVIKGDNCDMESTHQLQEKVAIISDPIAMIGCGKSLYTHVQTPFTGTQKSNKVSDLQKTHKRLSGLLSCNNTSGSGNFDLLASSSSLLSPVVVSRSSSLPTNLTAECSVHVTEKRDKNGELLQMLLTKGPSSYVRDVVLDVGNTSADLSNFKQVSDPLNMKSSSPTSSSSLRKILESGSSKMDLFVPKTSSPALRKILSASSCSNSPPSHLQQDNLNSPVYTDGDNPHNLSKNTESSLVSATAPVQGHTTSSGGRLESTIKKLLAKQAEDHVTPNTIISQGVRDLLNKNATDVTSCPSSNPMTCNTPAVYSGNTDTGHDISQPLLHIKQEPVDEKDGEPEQNVNQFMHWIDEVSSRLVDKLIKSEDGNEACGMLTNGTAGLTESEDKSHILKNLEKKLRERKKTAKPNIELEGASEGNLLDNKRLEDSGFSQINDKNKAVDKCDKYKTLQQHLLVKPSPSPQLNYSVNSVVNVPSILPTAVKRKDEGRTRSGTTNKKKTTDEDWIPPGIKNSAEGEPVKRPFVEMPLFYKCHDCGKAFEHKGTLKVHERIHSMEKQEFKCDICGKVCSAKGYLEIHMRTHLRELPPARVPNLSFVPSKPPKESHNLQTCTLCGKSFVEAENLLIHMRMHSGEKLYKCEICGNGFTRKTQLAIHMRIHTGEKPYECEVCGKTFRQSNGLNLHMTTHTDDKPYKCEICGGGFGRKAHYEKHMRKHRGERPFMCGVCNKGFTDKFTLSMHMKIHSKTKDHVCQICGKGYNQSTHLRNHMQFHSGDKGYRCDECNKLFEHKRTLKNHIKTIHSESYRAEQKSKRQIRNKRRAALKKKASLLKDEQTDELSKSASDDDNRDSSDGSMSSGEDSDQEMIAYTQVKEEPLDVYTTEVGMENVAEDANIHDAVYMERNEGEISKDNTGSNVLSPVGNIKQEIIDTGFVEPSCDVNSEQIINNVNELNAGVAGSDFVHCTIKEEPVDVEDTFSIQNSHVTF